MANGKYVYRSTQNLVGYSLVISSAEILHKSYMEMFQDPSMLPESLLTYTDRIMNCEDLAMCIMVTDFLSRVTWPQSSVILVQPKYKLYNMQGQGSKCTSKSISSWRIFCELNCYIGEGYKGLSKREDHYNDRSTCLNYFSEYYYNNTLPLVHTNAKVVYYHPSNKNRW